MFLTASRKFLMFSKYWIADCAAASIDCIGIIGFSTTFQKFKMNQKREGNEKKRKPTSESIKWNQVSTQYTWSSYGAYTIWLGMTQKHEAFWISKMLTFRTAPGLTLLRTLHRMRPLRSERQNSSSDGSLESVSEATWSIWRSHCAAWYLLEAENKVGI